MRVHTHTHTHTYAHKQIHMYTCAHTHTHTNRQTHTHAPTCREGERENYLCVNGTWIFNFETGKTAVTFFTGIMILLNFIE